MFASSSQAVSAIASALSTASLPPHAVIAIDGRTGSGKTSFAGCLAEAIDPFFTVCRVEVEHHIEGWAGLARGVRDLASGPIPEFRANGTCNLPVWDWYAGAWGPFQRIPESGAASIMLLTGCGAASRVLAPLVDGSVWMEASETLRRARVTKREGSPDSWWSMWEAQHTALLAEWDSPAHATWRVSASSE